MFTPVITALELWSIKWISDVTPTHFYISKRKAMQVYRIALFFFGKRNENIFGYMAKNFAYTKRI